MSVPNIFEEIAKSTITQIIGIAIPLVFLSITRVRNWLLGEKGDDDLRENPTPLARATLAGLAGLFGASLALLLFIVFGAPKISAVVNNVTSNRTFGGVYLNNTGRTRLVIVTASRKLVGNTMFGSISISTDNLPKGATGGSNATTIAAASFTGLQNVAFAQSFTFVVPDKYYYEVSTDGGEPNIAYWAEAEM